MWYITAKLCFTKDVEMCDLKITKRRRSEKKQTNRKKLKKGNCKSVQSVEYTIQPSSSATTAPVASTSILYVQSMRSSSEPNVLSIVKSSKPGFSYVSHHDEKPHIPEATMFGVPQTIDDKLYECWKYLSLCDEWDWFKSPVTEDIAPGYFNVIRRPMDLSTIKNRLHTYTCIEEFDSDVTLMIDNCFLYNDPLSDVVCQAYKVWKAWLDIKSDVLGSNEFRNYVIHQNPLLIDNSDNSDSDFEFETI